MSRYKFYPRKTIVFNTEIDFCIECYVFPVGCRLKRWVGTLTSKHYERYPRSRVEAELASNKLKMKEHVK